MPGSLYQGNTTVPKDSNLAVSYCEGRQASYASALKTTNPHQVSTEQHDAWDRGFDSDAGATPLAQDGCAVPPTEGV